MNIVRDKLGELVSLPKKKFLNATLYLFIHSFIYLFIFYDRSEEELFEDFLREMFSSDRHSPFGDERPASQNKSRKKKRKKRR